MDLRRGSFSEGMERRGHGVVMREGRFSDGLSIENGRNGLKRGRFSLGMERRGRLARVERRFSEGMEYAAAATPLPDGRVGHSHRASRKRAA
jgi:hypothetical protein